MNQPPGLKPTLTPGAQLVPLGEGSWRFEIPAGPSGRYRLAQLDDYGSLPRRKFPWHPPVRISVRLRASARGLPGTWGVGLWNNPFGMSILTGVEILRLPALPDAAWFFHGSPPNYLSLRDDIPAQGWLAATFRAPRLPNPLLALAAPGLPLLFFPPILRLARRIGRLLMKQDAVQVEVDVTAWHTYEIAWTADLARFSVDGVPVLTTGVVPRGPLGLVLWIDNQFAAVPPQGKLAFGTLENPEAAWIEVEGLQVEPG